MVLFPHELHFKELAEENASTCSFVPSQETRLEEEKKRAEEAQTSKRKDTDELRNLKRAKEDMENELEELRETVSQVRSYSPELTSQSILCQGDTGDAHSRGHCTNSSKYELLPTLWQKECVTLQHSIT